MARFELTIALVAALVLNLVAAAPEADLLRQVCLNDRVILTPELIDQLVEENAQTADSEVICAKKYRASIDSLRELLTTGNDDICSSDKANAIANYFEKHILDADNKAPNAIGTYYIAYGMKVSKACRQRMVNLIGETQRILSLEEQAEMDLWTNETSLISNVFNEPGDYDDLVLPKSLTKYLRTKPEKIFLQTVTGEKMKRLQVVCERRWKPIYEPLILPLVRLSSVGFNFRDQKEIRDAELNKLVYRWYRAVFLCETLSNMVILDDPNFEKTPATERSLIKILTKEDVENLPNRDELLQRVAASYPEVAVLSYSVPKESGVQLSGPIVDSSNQDLVNAVRRFKTTRKSTANFLQKMFNQVRERISSGLIKIVSKNANIPDANEFIKFLDGYENNLASSGESAVSNRGSIWGSVAKYTIIFVLVSSFLALSFFIASILPGSGGAPTGFIIWHYFG